jgi:hypothetical protein
MQTSLLQSVLVVALVGGCGTSGRLTYAGEVTAPDLVVISPGVRVIADFETPIFYSDNYYWRNASGFWYRSRSHTQGWARAQVVPIEIRAIKQPSAYIHYRGQGGAHVSGDRQDHPPATEPRDQREVPSSHRNDKNDKNGRHDRHDKDDRHDNSDRHDRHDNKDDKHRDNDSKHRDNKDGDNKRE